jgi:Leucine-rich repeat (LRR) protein
MAPHSDIDSAADNADVDAPSAIATEAEFVVIDEHIKTTSTNSPSSKRVAVREMRKCLRHNLFVLPVMLLLCTLAVVGVLFLLRPYGASINDQCSISSISCYNVSGNMESIPTCGVNLYEQLVSQLDMSIDRHSCEVSNLAIWQMAFEQETLARDSQSYSYLDFQKNRNALVNRFVLYALRISTTTVELPAISDHCGWDGVICNAAGNVMVLLLAGMDLKGTIPTELGLLSDLRFLDMGHNRLHGSLPVSLFQLTSLQTLSLSNNTLTGTIQPQLSSLSRLRKLELDDNNFIGTLPELNLRDLEIVNIARNRFQGTLPFSFNKSPFLRLFNIASNDFEGDVDSNMFPSESLQYLDLSWNKKLALALLDVGYLSSLRNLYLSGLNGASLSWNRLQLLHQIVTLDLSDMHLQGALPVLSFYSLEYLDLSNNELQGTLPSQWTSNLKVLDLSGNQFEGFIPSELAFLEQLNLERNSLTGIVPIEICATLFVADFCELSCTCCPSCRDSPMPTTIYTL